MVGSAIETRWSSAARVDLRRAKACDVNNQEGISSTTALEAVIGSHQLLVSDHQIESGLDSCIRYSRSYDCSARTLIKVPLLEFFEAFENCPAKRKDPIKSRTSPIILVYDPAIRCNRRIDLLKGPHDVRQDHFTFRCQSHRRAPAIKERAPNSSSN